MLLKPVWQHFYNQTRAAEEFDLTSQLNSCIERFNNINETYYENALKEKCKKKIKTITTDNKKSPLFKRYTLSNKTLKYFNNVS
jgi:hypothetical protein